MINVRTSNAQNTYSEHRVMNTHDLLALVRRAQQQRFNRVPLTPTNIDPEGTHVLERVLYGHNMEQTSVLHHRCRVLCKIVGSDDPIELMLDVSDDDFNRLHRVELAVAQ